jgi:tRNA A37 threonylcarbamoyladenosine synthetase subunit TsaC/SUA5/YrdC
MKSIEEFIRAWTLGKVCLHPTDTLPGLSFNPRSAAAEANFIAVKERSPEKSPISLVASWDLVARSWQPLPGYWEEILKSLWPSSLTVIWKASKDCPTALLAGDGTSALRMPDWSEDKLWMRDLLLELDEAFPSSSVNRSGDPAISDWAEAATFLKASGQDIFVPSLDRLKAGADIKNKPSTLIRIEEDESWTLLREGAVSADTIHKTWELYAKRS